MKNNNFICILALLSLTVSCNDDFTNVTPTDGAPESAIWNDPGLAAAAVTNVYENLSTGGFGAEMLSSLTDESVYIHTGSSLNTTTEGRANSSDTGFIAQENQWDYIYVGVRNANLAIKGLQEGDIGDDALRDRLLGEATFLRAFYYHKLVRFYGGVPLIDTPFDLDSDFNNPRNTYEECIEFIVKDCDAAFSLLDGESMDGGRATADAALALKARMLLDAASDLHDASTATANSSLLGGANFELFGYTSGDQQARWVRAKNAAQAVLDYAGGYKTGLSAPESLEDAKENYISVSLAQNGGEADILWERQFNTEGDEWGGKRIGLFNGPNGYHNWAGNVPIQNLIDAYAMEDGSDFDWDNPAHAAAPYENREPRFYASILYDGADWKPRTDDVASRDPANQIQTGSYEINSGIWPGLDTREGPVEDWNGTRTGYYVRKFINNDPSIVDFQQFQTIPWPFFRYTEAMLNFVETCIETGDEANAIAWLNKVRFRAGLPAITGASGADLVTAYRKERRVELAYEESRYFDIRRWMIPAETHGAPVKIINVSGALKPGASVDTYAYDKDNYDYTYTVQDIDPGFENRVWLDKMYYLPIHISQIQADPSLVQNPGYE